MALTFSPHTTARIVQIFRVLNSPRNVAITATVEILLAVLFYLVGWDWLAWTTLVAGLIDVARWAFLIGRRRRSVATRRLKEGFFLSGRSR